MSAQYLLDFFYEVGPCGSGGFGAVPLTFAELESWARLTNRLLQPWEFLFLRRLSMEWVSQSSAAQEFDCPSPWGETTPDQRYAVAMRLRAEMRAAAGAK